MELRQVSYFVAVARQGAFSRAVAEVGVAQPALSQQVRGLERELGVALFDRTSRRVRLTAAGTAFLPRAEGLLADATRARIEMQAFATLARGRLVIGTQPSLEEMWLPRLLGQFHRRHAGIEIVLREETTAQLQEWLRAGTLDLAVLNQDGNAPSDLTTAPLFTEDLALVVAADHRLAGQRRVALVELRDESWILLKPGAVTRDLVLEASAVAGFAPRVVCEVAAWPPVRALAAAGLGVAVVPRSVAVAAGTEVAVVEVGPPALARTVALAWRTGSPHAAAIAAFHDIAREAVSREGMDVVAT